MLEREPHRKLQLTHRGVRFDVRDFASIAAAVYAMVTLIAVKAQHRVIEHVECIHAELCDNALGDPEILQQ